MEADAAGVAYDDGADLQELEADSVRLSPGHRGAPQPQPADRRHHLWQLVRSAKRASCCSLMRFSISPRAQ